MGLNTTRCSFCGGGDLSIVESVLESGWFVICNQCEACGPPAETAEECVEKWEYRANEADIEKRPTFGSLLVKAHKN